MRSGAAALSVMMCAVCICGPVSEFRKHCLYVLILVNIFHTTGNISHQGPVILPKKNYSKSSN